jgi:succinyl-CoA synthetase beta subunit
MKLFEYQAKEVFREVGIPIPKGVLISNLSELDEALKEVGTPCVLKSQVLRGGRGKAGLIQLAKTAAEAKVQAENLFSSEHNVRKILVEQAVDIGKEIYLSITVDPVESKAMIIACAEGGVDIETLAVESPDKIIMEKIDLDRGLMGFQSKDVLYRLGLASDVAKPFGKIVHGLYQAFCKYDAELAEINPLFVTKEGDMVAGDAKLNIDDNSMFRQTRYEMTRDYFDTDAEYEAALEGIPYLQFDGDISLMCAGAGLTTTCYDLINYAGGSVASYLEFGGAHYKKAVKAMELSLKTDSKVILMVTFGTIARADVMAQGVVDAINKLKPKIPIVTCIRGTNEEEAVKILKDAGLEPIFDTEEAVQKAVDIAAGRV